MNQETARASDWAEGLPPPRNIDVNGVQTRYYDQGTGPETIVLIYGGNFGSADSASSAFVWSRNILELAKHHRVIAFDKLGQGHTAPPIRNADYTMAAVVAHAIALIERLDLSPFHVVGHSRGGFAAARIALEISQRVRSLTICSSGTLCPGVGLNEVVLAMPPFPKGSRDAARWVYQTYCARPDHVTEEWVDAIMEVLALPQYQVGVKKFSDELLGNSLFAPQLSRMKRETLQWIADGRLQRPTQIVWGANDKTVQIERGLALFEMIRAHERRTTFSIINDAGHFTFREHPQRFNALLHRFIESCRSPQ
ncbi:MULTISPECIES: alpha/beta fold hydrolase [Burkholderiaceae]|uniref:alpha/beta fold hydrolase n=1 Tax=Burkholderiaceae TaxID=119060 RepID=UPI000484ABA0|nr:MULTISPECIES: alpha/beta hydrolase [Burkholderiaceae]MDR9227707.1 Dihydrolipoyllysine-residue acetyltransferase component of acetoin cleaving system [Burkholderia multivorans]PRF10181.1 alpha/beta hydrolase [Burkholderia multivorans]HDR9471901.1 alpha/beta hydrolase [Burkholderia multivorans]